MANPLVKKLLLHKAQRALIINEPDYYRNALKDELPDALELLTLPVTDADFVQLFVKDQAELKQLFAVALKSIKYDGLMWVCYPKQSSQMKSDLNRDILVSLLHEVGFEGVFLVSIDSTWSAMRVRPQKD
jgi:hypothetical protein